LQSALVTRHAQLLTGLAPGTTYYFRVRSKINGTAYQSDPQILTTTNYLATTQVLSVTNAWSYKAGTPGGTTWTQPGFNAAGAGWSGPGAGLLWVDVRSGGPNTTVGPRGVEMAVDPATGYPFVTYYFRTTFNAPAATPGALLHFSGYVDDGAVFYLNGAEIYRLRMDDAPAVIASDTLAIGYPCSGDAHCLDEFDVDANVVAGTNTLAVEVHNYNARSADITFGTDLTVGLRLVVAPQIGLSTANNTAQLTWDRGGFKLQSAPAVTGPWTDVAGPVVASPYALPKDGTARFYRLAR
jgi:hypothetical protein